MKAPCDCCQGPSDLTPLNTGNRPGLAKLEYRVGTHGTFFGSMQALLSSESFFKAARQRMTHDGPLELTGLKTRDKSDPAIALLDAWAIVGDVLTFYQERIANEGYLRTATERRSVLELARLVGYTLRPGVASSVHLAYAIEKDSAPVEIPKGARVNTIPGPGEEMQAFETSEPMKARVEWNELKPRMTRPQTKASFDANRDNGLYLKGAATKFKPNDPILVDLGNDPLLVEPGKEKVPRLRRVAEIEPDVPNDRTRVSLQPENTTAAVSVKEMISDIRKRYDPASFGVSAEAATAKRVGSIMSELAARLEAEPEELVRHLQQVALPSLEVELQKAREGGYSKLAPWISGMVGELRQLDSAGTKLEQFAVGAAEANASEADLLSKILTRLKEAPSEVPANASKLARRVDQVFGPGADIVPRLITRIEPRLENFYSAWRNLQAADDPGITVYAMRIQASPFGHNAPLRPILDNDNKVTGHEEWLLAQLVETKIRLTLYHTTSIEVEVREGDTIYSSIATFNNQNAPRDKIVMTLGPAVTATVTQDREAATIKKIDVNFQPSGRNVAFIPIQDTEFSGDVSVRNESIQIPRKGKGDKTILTPDGATIAIQWDTGGPSGDVISISETALESKNIVDLDAVHEGIVPQSWVAIERPGQTEPLVAKILEVRTVSKAAYGITGKFTQLKLNKPWLFTDDRSLSVIRATTVSALSEMLPMAEAPIFDDVCGREIELGLLYEGLEAGRSVIVSGERSDIKDRNGKPLGGVKAAELQMIASIKQRMQVVDKAGALPGEGGAQPIALPGEKVHSFIQLAAELAYCYDRNSVKIYGNVVKSTHGETRNEVLGSGDAANALQQFALKQAPLTYVSAPTPAGIESSLTVRVNDVEWHEADSLAGLGPDERKFVTKTGDEGKTAVVFGNGRSGARLPTGQENVKATYRSGIGKPGNVKERQISLLATRPLGVKGVINPLRASGGAGKEGRDQARRNAPLAVTALDRLVSVRDHADFARTFAGIGKASAVARSDGRREAVYLTIAGADDIPIEKNSDLFRNLRTALHRYGDPLLPIILQVRERLALVLAARVRLLPDYLWEAVEPKIRKALLNAFSFDNLELGQDLFSSTASSVMQAVREVAYVDLDVFDAISEQTLLESFQTQKAATLGLHGRITVSIGGIARAQIAYLAPEVPDTLILQEIKT